MDKPKSYKEMDNSGEDHHHHHRVPGTKTVTTVREDNVKNDPSVRQRRPSVDPNW